MTWCSYEYCDKKSGESGVRSRSKNERQPLSILRKDPGIHILETGLTFDEARNRLSLTPEICRFTSEIDSVFGQQNLLDESRFKYIVSSIFDACKRIIEDRADREKFGFIPRANYLDVFVDVNAGDTGKYLVFRKLTSLFEVRPDGTIVDLKEATLILCKELLKITLEDQMNIWYKEN